MTRQSISFTTPNDAWLKLKVGTKGEYKSNSELVNDLIRKERVREETRLASIRAALVVGEKSGISTRTTDEIMNEVVERKRANDPL